MIYMYDDEVYLKAGNEVFAKTRGLKPIESSYRLPNIHGVDTQAILKECIKSSMSYDNAVKDMATWCVDNNIQPSYESAMEWSRLRGLPPDVSSEDRYSTVRFVNDVRWYIKDNL